MSRETQRFIALAVTLGSALGAYTLQPDNLELFGNPKLIAFIVGALMVAFNIMSNFLSSMFRDVDTEAQLRQRIRDLEKAAGAPGDQTVTVNVPGSPPAP